MSSSSNILTRAAHGALGVLNRVRAFFFASGLKSTSRVLVEQINTSLRLQPVSIACQAIGAAALVARFWDEVNRPLLILWALAVLAAIGTWGLFHRRFISDAERGAHIREWLQRWMMHTLAIGVVWGFAGAAFLMTQEVIDIVILVAVVVTVVFASWPVFSCWMPSLTLLVICALAPMMLTLAAAFDLGRLAIGAVLLVVVAFVLYCGRRLNEIVVLAVTREVQNERLVARLKSEKALAESERRATALASERRAKVFAGANHDLRQPLQAMGIYLQILQMQADDRTREVVEQLDATARSISTLVEQLLEVSRIEAGNLEVKMECVRIEDLMRDLAGEFEPVAAVKGLKFSTRPLPVSVKTDPMLVGRILRNLITNAIRYTNRPGARIVLAARRLSGGRVTTRARVLREANGAAFLRPSTVAKRGKRATGALALVFRSSRVWRGVLASASRSVAARGGDRSFALNLPPTSRLRAIARPIPCSLQATWTSEASWVCSKTTTSCAGPLRQSSRAGARRS